jgi:gliding motility-associated-like protein
MKNLLLGFFAFLTFAIHAQLEISRDVIGAAGQSVSNSNMQMSYTIGEPFTATIENNKFHTLGFQQPDSKPATELPFAIPGGLSPNGDGNNDSWDIQGLADYPDASVTVFDRWGQKVYSGTSQDPAWDGTTNGRECPTADYYYVIDLGNGQTYNGVVTLKK